MSTTTNLHQCLQCGQTQEQIRHKETDCVTLGGYEYLEVIDEWDRHYWRDWSNSKLKLFGIHPSLWEANRRTNIYDLEGPVRKSYCMRNGHTYSPPTDVCITCYEKAED